MEKSKLAGNAVTFLHEEDYLDKFAKPLITADSWLKVSGRQAISLDGDWGYTSDLFDTGFRQAWYRIERGKVPAVTDWNPFAAQNCCIPSVWNTTKAEYFHYEGGMWFARSIALPAEFDPATHKLYLRVGAANYCARLFIDSAFLGRHLGGSTPFCIDITDRLSSGRADLLIHVDNSRRSERLPGRHFDWFNYGGIHRSVELFIVPTEHLKDTFIRLGNNGAIKVDLETTLGLHSARIRIQQLDVDVTLALNQGLGQVEINAEPEHWSPSHPTLYEVEVTAGDDRLVEKIGFRKIETRGTEFLLNGEPLFLKGICAHEDDEALGRVTSDADLRRRFAHAKELGARFMRLAHYPHHERAAEIADEVGLLLWEELPVYWMVDFDRPTTQADAANQLTELIRRDRNRASVVIWGLANETANTESRTRFLATLADAARRLDDSRLLAAACLHDQETRKIRDQLTEFVDVVGLNEYFGWYDPEIAELDALLSNYDLPKPLIITETGADVVAGNQGPASMANTEAFGVKYMQDQIDTVRRYSAVAGFCPWILYDFRSERRHNPMQQGWNLKGLIARDKSRRKQTFAVVAEWYRQID